MPALSVVMIVKNEEGCLAQCLQSVHAVTDEIVIADTGSTDATITIAERFGARVFSIPWENDFAAARNRTLQAATGDWLLHLDADEVLDPSGAKRVRALVDADGLGADAIEVTLANYSNDPRGWRWTPAPPGDPLARGYAGYLRVDLLRLFRNRCGFEYRERVHENITESVGEKNGRIRHEDILIHHYGYDAPKARSAEKAALYLAIARQKLRERPDDPKYLYDFAENALAHGLVEEAEATCRRALAIDPIHLGSASTLATILLNRGDLSEARQLLERLETAGITPPHILTALAAIDCREGHLDDAGARLDAALKENPRAIISRLYRARVFDLQGEEDHAFEELNIASNTAPGLDEIHRRIEAHRLRREGAALLRADRGKEALEILVKSLRHDPEDPLTHSQAGKALHLLGLDAKARESFQRALRLSQSAPVGSILTSMLVAILALTGL
ncbi:MAG TPA: glycosyltransferase [Candidatus Hydrogenedentes bacterium]|nr:glycosyltransferase [Candidatus Hydrogenedentota bacterium]